MDILADLVNLSMDAKLLLRSEPAHSEELREILGGIIVRASNDRIKSRLIDELEPLQAYMIKACRNFGVKIGLLGRREKISDLHIDGQPLSAPGERTADGRTADSIRGFYYLNERLIVIGEEQIGAPGRLVSVHEFAHAYDHTFSENHFQSHYLSTQLWHRFSGSRLAPVTEYAGMRPEEYFAESLEAYFFPEGAAVLRRNDPEMYAFLGNLILR